MLLKMLIIANDTKAVDSMCGIVQYCKMTSFVQRCHQNKWYKQEIKTKSIIHTHMNVWMYWDAQSKSNKTNTYIIMLNKWDNMICAKKEQNRNNKMRQRDMRSTDIRLMQHANCW